MIKTGPKGNAQPDIEIRINPYVFNRLIFEEEITSE
jgi:hypothetical protein